MQRREFITYTLSAGALSGLAGCTYRGITVGDQETTEAAAPTTESDATTAAETTAAETTEAQPTTAEGTEAATTEAGPVTEVDVGPEGAYLRFVPERVEIPVGGTVVWTARSEGHNVSAYPEVARQVELPEGAEPFASYPEGESYRIIPVGETFQHTFTVPGEYVYVCVPHADQGMIGTVLVRE